MGGKFHLKLNMATRPIAYKYREGKLKRTLKKELKVLEIVKGEPLESGVLKGWCDLGWVECCEVGQVSLEGLEWSPRLSRPRPHCLIITLPFNQCGGSLGKKG